MGRSLGKGMREFKDTISGQERDANGLDPHQAAALARYEAERARAGNEEVVADDTD
jgi:Sec-independent protein translocase protein TatA